jgi:nucleotide-binding universal stress UspA family protein
MRHILVPTDFSQAAQAAIDYAVDLCRDLGGRLTLLHVIFADRLQNEFPGLDALGYLSASRDEPQIASERGRDLEQWKAVALEKLNGCINAKWPTELAIDTVVVEGRPSERIVEHARTQNVDLIVMGTHGRGPVAQFFLGSVTENVLRSASCPVLVVRHHE